MRLLLIGLYLISSFTSTGQSLFYQEGRPTFFDTFTKRSSIVWAAYANDTIKFNRPNISDLLIKRMEKGEIKSTYPIWEHDCLLGKKIVYTSKEENHQMFFPCCVDPIYDSLGRPIGDVSEMSKPRRRIDEKTSDLLWVTQILYVENGILKCYIPWVAPTFSAFISTGDFLFIDTYFGTCINLKYHFSNHVRDKVIYLGETKRKLSIDSAFTNKMIKQAYGWNILQAVWPYVTIGKISVFNAETNDKILKSNIDNFILSSKPHDISEYDITGNIIETRLLNNAPVPYYITEVEIVQQWYYNHTKNVVTCNIPELYLYAGRDDNYVRVKADKPVLKIVF